MAIDKVINIDVETSQAEQALNKFGKSINTLREQEFEPLSFAISELEDRLYEMASAGKQSTPEFKSLAQEVARMKTVILETDMAVDAMTGTMTSTVIGGLNGVASGFELGTGVMAAFGVESQALEETLLKVQSAMAISQGIQGIKEAIPSFNALKIAIAKTAAGQWLLNAAQTAGAVGMKVLNAVMNMNPVFLLITGVAALTAAIAYFVSEEEKAEEMNEKLNASYQKSSDLLNKVTQATEKRLAHELKMLEISGASEEELHKKRLSNMEEERKVRQIGLQLEQKNIAEKTKIYNDALAEGNSELAATIRTEITESKKRYADLMSQHKDYVYSKQEENAQYNKKLEEEAKAQQEKEKADYQQRLANWKEYQSNRLAAARQIEDAKLSIQFENEQKALDELNVWLRRQKEDTLANERLTQEEKIQLIALYEEQAYQKRKEIGDQFKIEMDTIKSEEAQKDLVQRELDLNMYQADEEYKTNVFKDHMEQRAAANAEAMANMEAASRGYTDSAMQGLQALDELNTFLTDQAVKKAGSNERAAEAARKKGFERSKKLQLAMAIISGVQGVMAAFTAGSSMGPAGVVMGPVMAALAAVTAGVNIAKIASMKYESPSAGGGGGAVPSAPSVSSAPSFNMVGSGGANQLQEALGGQEPMKAYVVGSEVTTQQSLDRNKVENATI